MLQMFKPDLEVLALASIDCPCNTYVDARLSTVFSISIGDGTTKPEYYHHYVRTKRHDINHLGTF
jgi:hypothetical protein